MVRLFQISPAQNIWNPSVHLQYGRDWIKTQGGQARYTITAWGKNVGATLLNASEYVAHRGGEISTSLFEACKRFRVRVHNRCNRLPPKRPPRLLTTFWLCVHLLMQAAIIATICILWHLSHVRKGIATVGDSQQPYFDARGFHPTSIWSSSIVWTTVPAWILSAYSAFWSAMLEVLTEAYRTLGLHKSQVNELPGSQRLGKAMKAFLGKLPFFRDKFRPLQLPPDAPGRATTAKLTLMLDYGRTPILNSLKAAYYGHVLLGLCMFLRAALWAAGGLSAAIFAVATAPFEAPVDLISDLYFNEYIGYDYGDGPNSTSGLAAMDVVSATLVNNGANYPWTTDTHSFLPFKPSQHDGQLNYTADTEAYWATVSCNVATQEDLQRVDAIDLILADVDDGSAQVYIHFKYAGCDVLKWFVVSNVTKQYGKSWAVTDCGLSEGRYRFGMIAGVFNASEQFWLSNLTVITCQPLFYQSNVSLTVAIGNDSSAGQILDFTYKTNESTSPALARRWLGDTPLYTVHDPVTLHDVDTYSRLVIGHLSSNRTLDTNLPPLGLLDSFGSVFQAYYANFVTLQAMFPAQEPRTFQGTVSRQLLRLFVADNAAWGVVGIMAFTFVVTVFLVYFLHLNQHVLEKHNDPILGDALTLRGSRDLRHYLEALQRKLDGEGANTDNIDLVEYARKTDLKDWVVWMEDDVLRIQEQDPMRARMNGSIIELNSM